MWIELHYSIDGKEPVMVNMDNIVCVRQFAKKSILYSTLNDLEFHVVETFDQIRQMVYPKTAVPAAPNLVMNAS